MYVLLNMYALYLYVYKFICMPPMTYDLLEFVNKLYNKVINYLLFYRYLEKKKYAILVIFIGDASQ